MKTLIAVPCMDSVAAGFAQSLATLNKVGECAVTFVVASLIYDSRNKIAKQALDMDADYIMWFDSDMIFSPDTMKKLMEDIEKKGCDIVSGLYCRRTTPYTPVLFKHLMPEENPSWEGYDDYPSDSLFEVDGIGFGCVLMKTDVLLDVAAKYGDWFGPIEGFGEDLSFCLRAKNCGYKIFCDSSVRCGHIGHTVITDEFYRAFARCQNESKG